MNIKELMKNLDVIAQAKLVPFIQGSPGIGKSDAVRSIADKYKLKLIDIRLSQCDPTDLNGLPKFIDNRATFVPFDTFPLEDTPVPEGYNGWLIFLDEINAASKGLQAVAYKLILDRMVGQHKLHKNCIMMCAGNKETDNAVVNTISTALRSRFITLPLEPDTDAWLEWSEKQNIDFRIIAYIRMKQMSGLYDFDPDYTDTAYACPRSWHMLSKLLAKIPKGKESEYENLVEGTIGRQASMFTNFCKYALNIPSIESILSGKAQLNMTLDLGMRYVLASYVIAHADKIENDTQAKHVTEFLDQLGKEFTIPFYNSAYTKNPKIMNFPAISSKAKEYAIWLRE
jgi:hypothetical protein